MQQEIFIRYIENWQAEKDLQILYLFHEEISGKTSDCIVELKWDKSADGAIAADQEERIFCRSFRRISGKYLIGRGELQYQNTKSMNV